MGINKNLVIPSDSCSILIDDGIKEYKGVFVY